VEVTLAALLGCRPAMTRMGGGSATDQNTHFTQCQCGIRTQRAIGSCFEKAYAMAYGLTILPTQFARTDAVIE
jgi:hypothetical protein